MTANGGDTLDTLMNHPAESERKKRGHARLGGPAEKRVAKLRARRKAKDRCPSRASSNSSFCPLASPPPPPPPPPLSLPPPRPPSPPPPPPFFFFFFFFFFGQSPPLLPHHGLPHTPTLRALIPALALPRSPSLS